ncbi:hypothetical protein DL764_007424 [Monosporascus ibericus]|uniref:Ubiquinol-cytochrome C reductase hinge domain-containing protein n=1 Tax=Monosporascus ibericus TaxID=155417 RepID=A0A4Q4T0S8_9PEZI|nr:hypothetical protein DL764_007424 [Monosporascus ibericus]
MGFWDTITDIVEAATPWSTAEAEAPPPEEKESTEESNEAEDGDEEEEEEEEEDEVVDPKEKLEEECANSKQCAPAKHHYDECVERVTGAADGEANEDCVEEYYIPQAWGLFGPLARTDLASVQHRSLEEFPRAREATLREFTQVRESARWPSDATSYTESRSLLGNTPTAEAGN